MHVLQCNYNITIKTQNTLKRGGGLNSNLSDPIREVKTIYSAEFLSLM